MSQFDFGLIDPNVRDGTWLADSLNQWRDALYSMHSGAAEPSYAVDGLMWRDLSGGAALTTIKQRQANAWRDLWTIDANGKVRFAGTVQTDGGVINDFLHLKGLPVSLQTDGGVTIGGIAVPGFHLTVRTAGGHCMGIIQADTAGNNAAGFYLTTPEGNFQMRSMFGRFTILDANRGFALRFDIAPTGEVCIGAGPAQAGTILHLYQSGFAQLLVQCGDTNQARVAFQNSQRLWTAGNIGGEFQIWDLTAGAKRFAIDVAGNVFNVGSTITGYLNVTAHADINAYLYAAQYVSTPMLAGGFANSGTLQCWNTANKVCFRWGGNALFYRVDEVLDRQIPTVELLGPGQPGPTGYVLIFRGVSGRDCAVYVDGIA